MGKRRNARESREYDIKLPNVNLGMSRYADIPSTGRFSGVDGPDAVRRYIMHYCLDDFAQGRKVIRLLNEKYNNLGEFATPIDNSQMQTWELPQTLGSASTLRRTQGRLFDTNPFID